MSFLHCPLFACPVQSQRCKRRLFVVILKKMLEVKGVWILLQHTVCTAPCNRKIRYSLYSTDSLQRGLCLWRSPVSNVIIHL